MLLLNLFDPFLFLLLDRFELDVDPADSAFLLVLLELFVAPNLEVEEGEGDQVGGRKRRKSEGGVRLGERRKLRVEGVSTLTARRSMRERPRTRSKGVAASCEEALPRRVSTTRRSEGRATYRDQRARGAEEEN